jgi:hypothetical protein
MEEFDLYRDIAERTQGDIYVGVVGPVRTGKSTFIKRFMDLLVIPNIDNAYKKERARDELPQSAAGKTIMTTEPKFVPNEAVEIKIKDNAKLKVRMVVPTFGPYRSYATGYRPAVSSTPRSVASLATRRSLHPSPRDNTFIGSSAKAIWTRDRNERGSPARCRRRRIRPLNRLDSTSSIDAIFFPWYDGPLGSTGWTKRMRAMWSKKPS